MGCRGLVGVGGGAGRRERKERLGGGGQKGEKKYVRDMMVVYGLGSI